MTVLLAANQVSTDFEDYAHLSDYLKFLFRENQQVIFSAVSSRFIKFLIVDPLEENVIETSYQVAQTLVHELEKGQKIIFLSPSVLSQKESANYLHLSRSRR